VAKNPQDPVARNLDQVAAPWIDQQRRVDLATYNPRQGGMNWQLMRVRTCRYNPAIAPFDVTAIQFMRNRNQY
jgi:hypothetical protein